MTKTSSTKLFARGNSYWLTRFVILRLLGLVYAVAFLVAAQQLVPLVGEHGLTPASHFLRLSKPSSVRKRPACCECRRSFGLESQTTRCRSLPGQVSVCRWSFLAGMRTRSFSRFSGRCTCRLSTLAKSGTATAGRFNCSRPGFCRSFSAH